MLAVIITGGWIDDGEKSMFETGLTAGIVLAETATEVRFICFVSDGSTFRLFLSFPSSLTSDIDLNASSSCRQ